MMTYEASVVTLCSRSLVHSGGEGRRQALPGGTVSCLPMEPAKYGIHCQNMQGESVFGVQYGQ